MTDRRMADQIESLLRSRRARVALALALAASGAWAFAPYMFNEVGGEAYVNAPLIRIASPIAGLAGDVPGAGSYVRAARRVRLVTARSVDSDGLGALLGQEAGLRAGLALAERQLGELAQVDARLAHRAASYGRAAVVRLAAGTAAARADTQACRAEAQAADLQQVRVLALAARGFAANAAVERARADTLAVHARCAALAARADAAVSEAGAARAGLYLGNGSSDTPYLEQQRDRLLLRRQELETVAAEARARLGEMTLRIAAERARLARLAAYDMVLPPATMVWAVAAAPGSSVAPGSALLDLADCTRRFVQVTLPERRMEALLPGQPVRVRLIGAADWQTGHVVRTAGAAARRDVTYVAANEIAADAHALTVEIALPPMPAAAQARRCDIGRLAEVRFPRWLG